MGSHPRRIACFGLRECGERVISMGKSSAYWPALRHSYAERVRGMSRQVRASEWPDPELAFLNESLAAELGLDSDFLESEEGVALLTGRAPEGQRTYSQAYAGHQFGMYSPLLGDGRAVLVGELTTPTGELVDLHVKGAGLTPFSRAGDGRALLGPMLREYLVSEWMEAVGIPTTRVLGVVTTGERVRRGRDEGTGALLCRVASSHLRVGTFQFAAATGVDGRMQALTDYAIERHWPIAAESDNPPLALLEQVISAQAKLVAKWMLVGCVHGVMNTDNMTISGETIDYGPCAFIDAYDDDAWFSSIDTGGRYRYGNQPLAAQWNLTRFAETLIPLLDSDRETATNLAIDAINRFPREYEAAFASGFAAKLGLAEPDTDLQAECLAILRDEQPDFTLFFRGLGDGSARGLVRDTARFDAFNDRRLATIATSEGEGDASRERMRLANPTVTPRNHVLDEVLRSAEAGDLEPTQRVLEALRSPFERSGEADALLPAPEPDAPAVVTFCGT